MRRGAALVLLLVIGATLAGCGKKSDPRPPPGEVDVFPRFYPNAPRAAGAGADQSTPSAPGTTGDEAEPAAPSIPP